MSSTSNSALLSLLSDTGQTVSDDDEDIRHRKVNDTDGRDIGHVADLLIDEREHKVRFLLVERGGFLGLGRTKTLVPVDGITKIDDDVHIDHSRDHVANGPGYDPALMTDPVYLGAVYDHYGSTPYWVAGYGYPSFPRHQV
jgi:sporulation protein YlmC with PRC-barrel domain